MGCSGSVEAEQRLKDAPPKAHSEPAAKVMQKQSSQQLGTPQDDSSIVSTQTSAAWKILMNQHEAALRFQEEGIIDKDSELEIIEFRALLDDAVACQFLTQFATSRGIQRLMYCWKDIAEFKGTDLVERKRTIGGHIYETYVRDKELLFDEDPALYYPEACAGAVPAVRAGSAGVTGSGKYCHNASGNNRESLAEADAKQLQHFVDHPECFDSLHRKCFKALYEEVFKHFRRTEEYDTMIKVMKTAYNTVSIDDFTYGKVLGKGTFGIVIQCVKKSTGKVYAMKIQTKEGLMGFFKSDPWRANLEMRVYSTFDHPFIVSLLYAFQTTKLVLLVLTLGIAGDLNDLLAASDKERLALPTVRFYCAELCSAIVYLHKRGLVHRDIKPKNILLNADGHILLTDFGAVADLKGDVLLEQQEQQQQLLASQKEEEMSRSRASACDMGDKDSHSASHRSHYSSTNGPDGRLSAVLFANNSSFVAANPSETSTAPALSHTPPVMLRNGSIMAIDSALVEDDNEDRGGDEAVGGSEAGTRQRNEGIAGPSTRCSGADAASSDLVVTNLDDQPNLTLETMERHKSLQEEKLKQDINFSPPPLLRAKSFVGTTMYMAPEIVTTLINTAKIESVKKEQRRAKKLQKQQKKEEQWRSANNLSSSGSGLGSGLGSGGSWLPSKTSSPTKTISGGYSGVSIDGEDEKAADAGGAVVSEDAPTMGYSKAVDWWSFGVTCYRMLTGHRFVYESEVNRVITQDDASEAAAHDLYSRRISSCRHRMVHEHNMKSDVVEFVLKLLTIEPGARLGSGTSGSKEVKKHPFFKTIKWKQLESMQIPAPALPASVQMKLSTIPGISIADNLNTAHCATGASLSSKYVWSPTSATGGPNSPIRSNTSGRVRSFFASPATPSKDQGGSEKKIGNSSSSRSENSPLGYLQSKFSFTSPPISLKNSPKASSDKKKRGSFFDDGDKKPPASASIGPIRSGSVSPNRLPSIDIQDNCPQMGFVERMVALGKVDWIDDAVVDEIAHSASSESFVSKIAAMGDRQNSRATPALSRKPSNVAVSRQSSTASMEGLHAPVPLTMQRSKVAGRNDLYVPSIASLTAAPDYNNPRNNCEARSGFDSSGTSGDNTVNDKHASGMGVGEDLEKGESDVINFGSTFENNEKPAHISMSRNRVAPMPHPAAVASSIATPTAAISAPRETTTIATSPAPPTDYFAFWNYVAPDVIIQEFEAQEHMKTSTGGGNL